MKFCFVIEDPSGEKMLRALVPKLIAIDKHNCTYHSYHGIGKIPPKTSMAAAFEAAEMASGGLFQSVKNQTLLGDLRRLLSAYADTYKGQEYIAVVICDLDYRKRDDFETKLKAIVDSCPQKPNAVFCLAIEEGEAWLLGDIPAIKKAYPTAVDGVLSSYKNDEICGTWEKLADAIYPGGSATLSTKTSEEIGMVKSKWAEKITPNMDVDSNKSPSFCNFRDTVRKFAQ